MRYKWKCNRCIDKFKDSSASCIFDSHSPIVPVNCPHNEKICRWDAIAVLTPAALDSEGRLNCGILDETCQDCENEHCADSIRCR